MSIKSCVDELAQINMEIAHNNARNKLLRQRARILETNINDYIAEKGLPGLKYRGKAVIIQEKESRPSKKNKDKIPAVISLFQELGVDDPEHAYKRLLDVQKKSPVIQRKIKFKKIPHAKTAV